MKTQALVPALALAAALLASPHAEADSRHRSEGGRGYSAHGDKGQYHGSHGYRSSPGYRNGYGHGYGYRPYYRSPRYYAPPPAYYGYGYGYGGDPYGGYYPDNGYGYYPPPPRCYGPRPRLGVGLWFGF